MRAFALSPFRAFLFTLNLFSKKVYKNTTWGFFTFIFIVAFH
jgi:hypothetical protein